MPTAYKITEAKTGYWMTADYFDAGFVRVTDSYGNIRHEANEKWADRVAQAKAKGCQITYAA